MSPPPISTYSWRPFPHKTLADKRPDAGPICGSGLLQHPGPLQIPFFCFQLFMSHRDRLCGLVVRVLGYRSGGPGSIPGTTKKKVVGLERGPLSLVSTTEELLDRKIAAPV
jgi:hypothetical protein